MFSSCFSFFFSFLFFLLCFFLFLLFYVFSFLFSSFQQTREGKTAQPKMGATKKGGDALNNREGGDPQTTRERAQRTREESSQPTREGRPHK